MSWLSHFVEPCLPRNFPFGKVCANSSGWTTNCPAYHIVTCPLLKCPSAGAASGKPVHRTCFSLEGVSTSSLYAAFSASHKNLCRQPLFPKNQKVQQPRSFSSLGDVAFLASVLAAHLGNPSMLQSSLPAQDIQGQWRRHVFECPLSSVRSSVLPSRPHVSLPRVCPSIDPGR